MPKDPTTLGMKVSSKPGMPKVKRKTASSNSESLPSSNKLVHDSKLIMAKTLSIFQQERCYVTELKPACTVTVFCSDGAAGLRNLDRGKLMALLRNCTLQISGRPTHMGCTRGPAPAVTHVCMPCQSQVHSAASSAMQRHATTILLLPRYLYAALDEAQLQPLHRC